MQAMKANEDMYAFLSYMTVLEESRQTGKSLTYLQHSVLHTVHCSQLMTTVPGLVLLSPGSVTKWVSSNQMISVGFPCFRIQAITYIDHIILYYDFIIFYITMQNKMKKMVHFRKLFKQFSTLISKQFLYLVSYSCRIDFLLEYIFKI